ncbi:uncharacterized protein LOC125551395 [Triticum urartu]|uniref:uncharacterized protein LOC125551395 n=1 Tax=Triticum urartu TaxID=4572 RepID=UPI0020448867|nr:uncharacterized protein LOC125551395 [Triticum urartu]
MPRSLSFCFVYVSYFAYKEQIDWSRTSTSRSTLTSSSATRAPSCRSTPLQLLTSRRASLCLHDTETDAAATQYDYGVDDPSLLPEQPDIGAQVPDATIDDDYYYSGGAYYYVQPADGDQE